MDEVPPPLPIVRWEPLMRGLLILSAINRVVLILFYLSFALLTTIQLKIFLHHLTDYVAMYVADLFLTAIYMWDLWLLSILLAWLFFSRRRMFRPLMIYFCFLLPLLIVGAEIHWHYFPIRTHAAKVPYDDLISYSGDFVMAFWPLYYFFSPRVKRVFTR